MRANSIDRLKFWLSLGIVCLHGQWLMEISPIADNLTSGAIFRLAVPFFAIVSGYFFSTQTIAGRRKWCYRVVTMHVVWTLVYSYFWFPHGVSAVEILKTVKTLLFGYFHLWYLPAVVIAAILTHHFSNNRMFPLFVGLAAIVGLCLQAFSALKEQLPFLVYRNGVFFILPFFFIGYKTSVYLQYSIKPWIPLASISLAAVESYAYFILAPGKPVDIFISLYVSAPLVVAYALQSARQRDCGTNPAYALSDWIYLSHPLFLFLFQPYMNKFSAALTACAAVILSGFATRTSRRYLSARGIPA